MATPRQLKITPQARLKEQIQCLRECAKHLSDLAPDLPPDTETLSLIAANLRVTADYAANLLALHNAQQHLGSNGIKKGKTSLRSA